VNRLLTSHWLTALGAPLKAALAAGKLFFRAGCEFSMSSHFRFGISLGQKPSETSSSTTRTVTDGNYASGPASVTSASTDLPVGNG